MGPTTQTRDTLYNMKTERLEHGIRRQRNWEWDPFARTSTLGGHHSSMDNDILKGFIVLDFIYAVV